MNNRVFLVIRYEPSYESTILGVYTSVDLAKHHCPKDASIVPVKLNQPPSEQAEEDIVK